MPTNMKIDYVELPAADFDSQQRFFEAVFNWSFTSYGEQYHAFTDGNIDGGFYKSDLISNSDAGATLVIFYALDLAEVERNVLEAGGKIKTPVFDFPGGQRFHFTDPHGNEYAVWSDQGL
jgi:predicted enzyme related to lactoylglutathione lyase